MAKKESILKLIVEAKEQNDNAIMFIAGGTTFQAFYDDAIVVNLLCDFPLVREMVYGQLVWGVSVPFSELEKKIPIMLRAGYKVIVYGSKKKTIFQK